MRCRTPNSPQPRFRWRPAFAPGCRRCLPRISRLLKRRDPQSILQSRNLKSLLRAMAYRRRNPHSRGRRRWSRPASARRSLPERLRDMCRTFRPAPARHSLPQRPRFQRHRSLPVKERILNRIPFRLSLCPRHLLLHSIGRNGRSLRTPAWAATHRRPRLSSYPPEHCRSHCRYRPRRPTPNHPRQYCA